LAAENQASEAVQLALITAYPDAAKEKDKVREGVCGVDGG
jgi:hypothetical protein